MLYIVHILENEVRRPQVPAPDYLNNLIIVCFVVGTEFIDAGLNVTESPVSTRHPGYSE